MCVTDSRTKFLEGEACSELEAVLCDGGDEAALAAAIGKVAAAVRCQTGDPHLAEDAALSACRTYLRRRHGGTPYTINGPNGLVGLLICIARRKAATAFRRVARERVPLANLPEMAVPADAGREDMCRAMREQLQEMLDKVRDSLALELHRKILEQWLDWEYGGANVTRREIAASVGCSLATVERVIDHIRRTWGPLLLEARRVVGELDA